MRSKARLLTVAVTVTVSALLAGCSGGDKHIAAAPKDQPSPTLSTVPTPTAPATPALVGDPFTGLAPVTGPVVAIKVDNGFLARPYQRGLTQAAIVYQELVEGGATRFMAVFEGTTAAKEVGPVRSARESDIDVLRGLGKPAIGFSGANKGVLRIFAAAARKGYLVDASYDVVPGAYRLGERRRDARNFFTVPARLAAKRPGIGAKDIGWRFGPTPAGAPATSGVVVFSPQSKIAIRYNAGTGRYVLSEGSHVIPVSPANLVVQYVTTRRSRFSDVHGMNTPYTVSTGAGRLAVLRDGLSVAGTWKRNGYGPTRLLDATGHDILLKPGPTWVFLMPKVGGISFR